MNFDYDKLIEDIKASPEYVKENVACYFYHNTQACQRCPKLEECPRKEPQPMPPVLEDNSVDPNEIAHYTVPVTEYSCIAVPNPKTFYPLFCGCIKDLALGKYTEEIKKRIAQEKLSEM